MTINQLQYYSWFTYSDQGRDINFPPDSGKKNNYQNALAVKYDNSTGCKGELVESGKFQPSLQEIGNRKGS